MLAQMYSAGEEATASSAEGIADVEAKFSDRVGSEHADAAGFHLVNVVVHAATCASTTWLFRGVFAGEVCTADAACRNRLQRGDSLRAALFHVFRPVDGNDCADRIVLLADCCTRGRNTTVPSLLPTGQRGTVLQAVSFDVVALQYLCCSSLRIFTAPLQQLKAT